MGRYILRICRDINLESLFEQFNDIDNKYIVSDYNEIIVDFSKCRYISPSALTVLVSYLVNKIYTSHFLDISVKPNSDIDQYISRMDFYNILGIDNYENFNRYNEAGRFITIKNITAINYDLVDEIMAILVNNDCISKSLYYTIDWSFNELLDNVFEHSQSHIGGFLIAQSYKDHVEFCVVDNGIGIPGSLKQNAIYANLNNIECLIKSTEKQVTVGSGQGNGLYITRRFVERNLGEMHIYSNNGHLYIGEGNCYAYELDNKWDGTIITLKVNKNIDIDIYDVFDTNKKYSLPSRYLDEIDNEDFLLW